MKVEIDGVNYMPGSIRLGTKEFDDPERILWEIYSWYTHRVWLAGSEGAGEYLKEAMKDCSLFEQCISEVFGMKVPDGEYKFVEKR